MTQLRSDDLASVVHHGELLGVLAVMKDVPAVDWDLDLIGSVRNTGGAPLPWYGVLIPGVGRQLPEYRRYVGAVGDVLLVDGYDDVGGHKKRYDVAARHHDVVSAGSGLELGNHLLVALIRIVGHLDSEFFLEVRNRVLGDVVGPVVEVEFLLDRPQIRCGHVGPGGVASSGSTLTSLT